MEGTNRKRRTSPAVWTLAVIGIGVASGLLLAAFPRAGRPGPFHGLGLFETLEDVDVVLSTIGLATLVALLVVYAKTYADTGARFALGLIFVLAALLFQALLTSPLLFGLFGHELGGLGPFVLVADAFKAAAFVAFLYLSLQ
jgi:hypothetical protein